MRTRRAALVQSVRWGLVLVLGLTVLTAASAPPDGDARDSIPWGAMYTPNEHLIDGGMTGSIKHYRGTRGAVVLVDDLTFAEERGVRLILTLGSVAPDDYLDEEGHLSLDDVRRELDPFFALSSEIAPFIESGTIWGIRFIDEPHDPAGYPPSFEIDPAVLSEAFALIRSHLGDVRVGSTAPPAYMARVPGAGFASGQNRPREASARLCGSGRLPSRPVRAGPRTRSRLRRVAQCQHERDRQCDLLRRLPEDVRDRDG